MADLSRMALVQQLRKGDRQAFEALFREHYAMLCNFSRKFVGDMDEAEELVQDLFVQVWEKRQDLELNTSVRSYLFTAARNRCLNLIKHRKVREDHADHVKASPAGADAGPEAHLEAAELEARIQQGIAKLPDRCRQIFRLSRFEGKKYQEIADELQISPRTVETQIGKALKLLRRELQEYLPLALLWLLWEVWK